MQAQQLPIVPSTGANSMSVDQMLDALREGGVVDCNSPKNRARLYARLQALGAEFTTEVIGYTDGRRRIGNYDGSRRAISWDMPRVARWIHGRRLCAEEIRAWIAEFPSRREAFPWKPAEAAFCDPDMSIPFRRMLIERVWARGLENDKFAPFEGAVLHKTVVRIRLVAQRR